MKVTLFLSYRSSYGEELFVSGNIAELRDGDGAPLPMSFHGYGWTTVIYTSSLEFDYHFLVKKDGQIISQEDSLSHHFGGYDKKYQNVLVYDYYGPRPKFSRMILSSVFSKAVKRQKESRKMRGKCNVPIIFNTATDSVNFNHRLAISGSDVSLGKWTESNAKVMNGSAYPNFSLTLDANKLNFPLEYKYVIYDPANEQVISWENGWNRLLNIEFALSTDLIVVNDKEPQFDLPAFRGAGTAVPVFSLRSGNSFGCGEFLDLKLLADWVAKTGQRIIQTLPVNDTSVHGTWRDSYPYSAISVFALHPMYLNIERVGELKDRKRYLAQKAKLGKERFVDYEAVISLKWGYIKDLYKKYAAETFATKEYGDFYAKNRFWLETYAVFCSLRDKYHTSDFSQWGEESVWQKSRIEQLCSPKSPEYKSVALHFFVQYHLYKQLREAVEYAHGLGVAIKGDIPIGVNACSADVWEHPALFDRTGSAGAPPDYFSQTGQIWGFPIYNWDEMAKDGYAWWRNRFQCMSRYFDAYRIDHILGFFRIFRVPSDAQMGLLGQFDPALPLSVDEIRGFGISLPEEELCKPHINEWMLDELFGDQKEAVKKDYLRQTGDDSYALKPQVSTQAKIVSWFESHGFKDKERIKTGLLYLVCQVYFVEDCHRKGLYHPRISIEKSLAYRAADEGLKQALKNIYEYFYYHRHEDFWRDGAVKKLGSLIRSTDMMVCGEDLGMVPGCVPSVMRDLEILSLEIQRMPKEMYVEFGSLERIPRMSVCTTSTHDMSTMRQWWEEDASVTQRYFNNELKQYGDAPKTCEPWICQLIVEKHMASPAVWVILPLQDWMAIDGSVRNANVKDERINDPSNPDNYWRYRMHVTLEELLGHEELNQKIRDVINHGGRG
ncbi:MAG: 4-alpha-glucanotransferase [Paludibacteraceae bacterium]|nr:4-alpha-glucanotransferase [Paludibacteraceae bacterium]